MMLHATFNNISVTGKSQRSVVLLKETGKPCKTYRPAANHCQTFITDIQQYFEVITPTVNLMCPFLFETLT
jgi:hypothetical protein